MAYQGWRRVVKELAMKSSHAFALALSVTCLFTIPSAFADTENKKTPPPKQAASAPPPKQAASAPPAKPGATGQSGPAKTSSNQPVAGATSTASGGSQAGTVHKASAASTTTSPQSTGSHPGSSQPGSKPVNGQKQAGNSNSAQHPPLDKSGHYPRMSSEGRNAAMRVSPNQHEREHAFERSRVERAQFRRHAEVIRFGPSHRPVLTHMHIVPTTYYYRRTVFYDTYGWAPPAYVYGLYPRYGLWDTTFLAFALDHVAEEQYSLMLYNHQHDPEVQQWMSDTDRLAADNAELRGKLNAMKTQMASLDQNGQPVDTAYVPPDAQDVALSPEVIAQLTSK
jgi:hypothetical protein